MERFWFDAVGRLTFAFQPIVSCKDGRIIAVEALLRGFREAGFRSILDVFDLAANDNALVEVELGLREKAVRLFALLPLADDVLLFSNLDNRVLSRPEWRPGTFQTLMERAGISPSRLVLEVSEHHPFPHEKGRLEDLVWAVDDFGTGYAGLQTLALIQPSYVKIDRFFVTGLASDPAKQSFLEGVINLAHRGGASVIAEGVETWDEAHCCARLGCDAIQGYAVGAPAWVGSDFSEPDVARWQQLSLL